MAHWYVAFEVEGGKLDNAKVTSPCEHYKHQEGEENILPLDEAEKRIIEAAELTKGSVGLNCKLCGYNGPEGCDLSVQRSEITVEKGKSTLNISYSTG